MRPMLGLIIGAAMVLLPAFAQAKNMRLAVTTSFHNSGLSDVLLPKMPPEEGDATGDAVGTWISTERSLLSSLRR